MVVDSLRDGVRIGQLLASEITGNHGHLRALTVTDADPDVEPTPDGVLAYRVRNTPDNTVESADEAGTLVAEVYVHADRCRVEFVTSPGDVAAVASEQGLRVRPKAVHPPQTIVFVEDGAQVKRVLPVFDAAAP